MRHDSGMPRSSLTCCRLPTVLCACCSACSLACRSLVSSSCLTPAVLCKHLIRLYGYRYMCSANISFVSYLTAWHCKHLLTLGEDGTVQCMAMQSMIEFWVAMTKGGVGLASARSSRCCRACSVSACSPSSRALSASCSCTASHNPLSCVSSWLVKTQTPRCFCKSAGSMSTIASVCGSG